jgi:hypothetical protein
MIRSRAANVKSKPIEERRKQQPLTSLSSRSGKMERA